MLGEQVYKIYAPMGAKWTNWVRPVPFVAINTYSRKLCLNWQEKKIIFINNYIQDTAIFIDLPGKESIEFGVALAHLGYRPIPLFNGTDEQNGSKAIVDTDLIESSLIIGSEKLKAISLAKNANPAFLLDSYRTNRYRATESLFDNSWDIYKQDVPTGDYLLKNGIKKIILITQDVQRDLKKILLDYQNKGIEIYLSNGYVTVKKVKLKKTLKEIFEKEEI